MKRLSKEKCNGTLEGATLSSETGFIKIQFKKEEWNLESFDESGISAVTVSGETLIIEGSDISVTDVNLESRQLSAQGIFSGFFYNDDHKEKRKHSLLSSLFGKL